MLYNVDVLERSEVSAGRRDLAADDPYIERRPGGDRSLIADARLWITNDYERNGLSVDADHVLGCMLHLARGCLRMWRRPSGEQPQVVGRWFADSRIL